MPNIGIRLQLLMGPTKPVPAPYPVMDALIDVEVSAKDSDRNGFQMTFSLSKEPQSDYWLFKQGYFDPPGRVVIAVTIGSRKEVLIDGIITNNQLIPSEEPGQSRLIVTGEDISLKMDLEEKSITHSNQSDSTIVTKILNSYATYGFQSDVTNTDETPHIEERVPNQQGTDLGYIQQLAKNNGFVFYISPILETGKVKAYWGPDNRRGQPQQAITANMGPFTNVNGQINFSFNALGPVKPEASIMDSSKRSDSPVDPQSDDQPPLSKNPVMPLRTVIRRDTAKLSYSQARILAKSDIKSAADAVTATGQIDSLRYGQVLKVGGLVGLRGVGRNYDGSYYVQQVTHKIKRGEYTQSFTLKREGLGALSSKVVI